MKVKRYDAMHKDVWTDESGKYVRYDDYAALKIERDSLKNKMELINGLMEVVEQANALSKEHVEKLVKELDEARGQVVSLAVELSVVEAIHTECVFITDELYEQCPPEVQKVIRSLAVMQMPSAKEAIANWQAQGVEKFAEFCRLKGEVRAFNFFNDAALNAEEFAAELRKGAAV